MSERPTNRFTDWRFTDNRFGPSQRSERNLPIRNAAGAMQPPKSIELLYRACQDACKERGAALAEADCKIFDLGKQIAEKRNALQEQLEQEAKAGKIREDAVFATVYDLVLDLPEYKENKRVLQRVDDAKRKIEWLLADGLDPLRVLAVDDDRARRVLEQITEKPQTVETVIVLLRTLVSDLGHRLNSARLRAGQTQEEAAEDIGIDRKAVYDIETGDRQPRPANRKAVMDYINRWESPSK